MENSNKILIGVLVILGIFLLFESADLTGNQIKLKSSNFKTRGSACGVGSACPDVIFCDAKGNACVMSSTCIPVITGTGCVVDETNCVPCSSGCHNGACLVENATDLTYPGHVYDIRNHEPRLEPNGYEITLDIYVRNIGNFDSGPSKTTIGLGPGDIRVLDTPNVPPGEVVFLDYVTFGPLPNGSRQTIRLEVDSGNDVVEAREDNNVRTHTFNVG